MAAKKQPAQAKPTKPAKPAAGLCTHIDRSQDVAVYDCQKPVEPELQAKGWTWCRACVDKHAAEKRAAAKAAKVAAEAAAAKAAKAAKRVVKEAQS